MKYTIEGFNQAKAVELGLCVADLIILRWFVDFAGTDKMLKRNIEGTEYYWIKYEGLLEDLPILSITKDTLYRRLKGLVEKDVLDHITVKDAGTYSFYKLGKNYLALITDTPIPLSEKNPTGYGKKSDRGTEKNPYLNTNLQKNTQKQKDKPFPTEKGGASKKSPSYDEVFNAPENEYIREALIKWVKACKNRGVGFQYKTLERWASSLRDNAGESPEAALAIVDQSIDAGWKDLYKLKKKPDSKPRASMERFDPDKDKLATGTDGKPLVY